MGHRVFIIIRQLRCLWDLRFSRLCGVKVRSTGPFNTVSYFKRGSLIQKFFDTLEVKLTYRG